MTHTIRDLISDKPKIVKIKADETVQQALLLMAEHDYSQLPVVDNDDCPIGILSNESILNAIYDFGVGIEALLVHQAMSTRYSKVDPDDELFDALDEMTRNYSAMVVEKSGKVIGIVTHFDTSSYFREQSEAMLMLEEIELQLREHVQAAFGYDDVQLQDAVSKKFSSSNKKIFNHLTFFDYEEMLFNAGQWDEYKSTFRDLSKDAIKRFLDSVRTIRNTQAHFRGEITAYQRRQLQRCKDFLALYPPPPRPVLDSISTSTELPDNSGNQTEVGISPIEEPSGEQDSKYTPLGLFLQGQTVDTVTLQFSDVEKVINAQLPPAAKQYRTWWANDSSPRARAQIWLEAGWRVSNLSITDQRVTFVRMVEREKAYVQFFSQLLTEFKPKAPFKVADASPQGTSWLTVAYTGRNSKGLYSASIGFAFTRGNRFRAEFYIDTGDQADNKRLFDELKSHEREIEGQFGDRLSWERMEDRRASRIATYHAGAIQDTLSELKSLQTWAVDAMVRLYLALNAPLQSAVDKMTES